ncbi:SDR family NAD(P)-dependent oxidoreductase [Corticibacterium sp. UT-5YL-CI-8]|nr:SDR family NAD(P)-dependent oxidoreductase [Tianweitania sp. UT-5YL-CI-8]
MRIDDKVVVITGAESGIGRAIAVACAAQGARLALAGLDRSGLRETADLAGGNDSLIVPVDICDRAVVAQLYDKINAKFGQLDAVVANAGITLPKMSVLDMNDGDWDKMVSVNLTETYNTVIVGARRLVAQGRGGSIIATGSSTVLRGMAGLTPYIATKAGVHGLMRQLALELASHRIRVNTLVPGTTATALARSLPGHLEAAITALPMGEPVEPEELGRFVAFALSNAMPHMTGSNLCIDSGRIIA